MCRHLAILTEILDHFDGKQIGKCAKGRSSLDTHPITKCYTFMECMFHVYSKMPRLGRIYSRNHKLLPRYTGLLKVYIYARPNIYRGELP